MPERRDFEHEDSPERKDISPENQARIDELAAILSKAASEVDSNAASDRSDFDQLNLNKKKFAQEFVKEHSDAKDYQLYHLLIGSRIQGSKFDTEDNEIENYIRSLRKED
ncbi:MAG: hypothetical protein WDN47_02540 [Candidatus Doudnabacteria bacterium]